MVQHSVSRKRLDMCVFTPPAPPPPPTPGQRLSRDEVSFGPASLLNVVDTPVYSLFTNKTKEYRNAPTLYTSPRYPSGAGLATVYRDEQLELTRTLSRTVPNSPPSPRHFPEPAQSLPSSTVLSEAERSQLAEQLASLSRGSSPAANSRSRSTSPPSKCRDPTATGGVATMSRTVAPLVTVGTELDAMPTSVGEKHLLVKFLQGTGGQQSNETDVSPRVFRLSSTVVHPTSPLMPITTSLPSTVAQDDRGSSSRD
jgi:hypothetical protein